MILAKNGEIKPDGAINAGEEKDEEIGDTGTKMASRQVAEDYIAANQPATDGCVDDDHDADDDDDDDHCDDYNDDDDDDQLSIRSSLAVTEVKVILGQPPVAEHSKAIIMMVVTIP